LTRDQVSFLEETYRNMNNLYHFDVELVFRITCMLQLQMMYISNLILI